MYQAHYINPLIQFGRVGWDLVLADDRGQLPEIRVQKSYIWPPNEDTIQADANLLIIQTLAEKYETDSADYQNNPSLPEPVLLEQDPVVATVDLPEGVSL